MAKATPSIQQISLALSVERNQIAPASAANPSRRKNELEYFRKYFIKEWGGGMEAKVYDELYERLAPFHMCIPRPFAARVRDFHHLLDKALIDIVERWFRDEEANFPGRMPLERHEEDLLRWIDGPGADLVRPFRERYGTWRTDYLIERDVNGEETLKICEINARIPFNGIYMIGLHGEAFKQLIAGNGPGGFEIPNDFERTKRALMNCFDQSLPLHHVHSMWPGVDSDGFLRDYLRRTGQPATHIKPSDLRLKPDSGSPGGYLLQYQPNEASPPETVHQLSLELFQEEIAELDPVLLRKMATCSFNDFRTILLLHDKRILGILLEEAPNMVLRGVLTPKEGSILRNGICDTLISGTERLKSLLQRSIKNPSEKDFYIIKPIRDASGNGIRLGEDIGQDEWLRLLEDHCGRPLRPAEGACVIQRVVDHVWYDIVRHEKENDRPEKFHLIGSQHMINSQLGVFGPWRIGKKVHVGLAGGGAAEGIGMSSVLRPEPDLPCMLEAEEP